MTLRLPVGQPLVWNQAALDALGTVSDRALAKVLGITAHTVGDKRRALGIPVYGALRPWTPAEDARLGTVPDVVLGKLLRRSKKAVQARRRLLNIPAWQQQPRVLTITCVVCGKKTQVSGRRASRLRQTCLPEHRITRAGHLSDHHKQLISATLKVTGNQPLSARGLVKNLGGSSVIQLLDD